MKVWFCVAVRDITPLRPNSSWLFHRDRLISGWLPLLAECPLTPRTFEESALLRDRSAVDSLSRIVHTLHQFTVTLEPSLVRGVDL